MSAAETRFGVYFVPRDGSALARFGQGVLGRDALARPVAAAPPLPPPPPPEWIAAPARYGFHATLKAPFRLAAGTDEAGLRAACEAIAGAHAPCPLPSLAPATMADFTALVTAAPVPAVEALAADCVTALEPFRAPLDAAALARRRPERLDAAARARLERWGYPHVLEGFRFHMTLSAPLAPSAAVNAWRAALARAFATLVGSAAVLDRVALCREAGAGAPFVRVAEFPLRGAALDDARGRRPR